MAPADQSRARAVCDYAAETRAAAHTPLAFPVTRIRPDARAEANRR